MILVDASVWPAEVLGYICVEASLAVEEAVVAVQHKARIVFSVIRTGRLSFVKRALLLEFLEAGICSGGCGGGAQQQGEGAEALAEISCGQACLLVIIRIPFLGARGWILVQIRLFSLYHKRCSEGMFESRNVEWR